MESSNRLSDAALSHPGAALGPLDILPSAGMPSFDRFTLYQKSVQDPDSEIIFLEKTYQELRHCSPLVLREDFCGTGYLATEWSKSAPEHYSVGVDLCAATLQWGQQNNVAVAGEAVAQRVDLVCSNVLEYYNPERLADIICAFNFSYNILKSQQDLLDYFTNAHRGLNDRGLLVIDIFGGTASYDTAEEEREIEDTEFSYIWEQERFNPITHEMLCHIHFKHNDGTQMKKAFSYEWRLRTIPELVDSLKSAGFSKVRCYWEEFVESKDDAEYLEETGNYYETSEVENQESWISYLVAEK